MAYITLLSSVLSFFLIAISADVQDITVDEYHINIELDPTKNYVFVVCHFVFTNFRPIQEINIYMDKLVGMSKVYVIKKDTDINLGLRNVNINRTTRIVTFCLQKEMDPGFYVMNISSVTYFDSAFNQVYSDRIHKKEVMWLSFSHFQPIWIQSIVPCWVRPKEDTSWRDMPTLHLSILHPVHYSVLTNMPIREVKYEKALKPDMKRTYFDIIHLMSPYQLSIVVTNFTHTIIDKDDVVSMWCRSRSASSLQFALTIAKNITTYLHFNRTKLLRRSRFSMMRVKLIVIPKIPSYSNESFPERNDSLVHPGIIIANEDDITYNEENDSVGRKYNVIRLLGYKVTQEYYEWIVNPYWEPSTWLSKSFATFIAMHIFNQTFPNLRMTDLFVVQIQHECFDFDVDNGILPFPNQNGIIPVEIIDNMKASIILRMLQHFIYWSEAFWEAIDTFINESIVYKKELHLEIFWKTLKDVYDKIHVEQYDIKGMMHPWVEEKGYPVLTVIRNYSTSRMNISIENINDPNDKRAIPVSYTTRKYLNFNRTRPYRWLISRDRGLDSFPADDAHFDDLYFGFKQVNNLYEKRLEYGLNYKEDSWIIFNIQQIGYYRVNYDDENWARISKYLNGKDYWKIHVLNRAQLIDDAFHFMLLGKLKADIFWQLTKYLERETDYIAWYPMFKAIEYITSGSVFYKTLYFIRPNLDKMLDMLLRNIKYTEQLTDNDFIKALRQEAVHWACSLKMSHCTHVANLLLKLHLGTHTKLSPWWKKWTYCYGLIEADNITWHQTLNKIKGNDNDKMLYLLTCPNYLVQINNYISTTYTNYDVKSDITPSTIVQFELRRFVYTIVESVKNDEEYNDENDKKEYMNTKFFKNLLNNFADIQPRQLKFSTTILILFNNIFSIEHIDDVRYVCGDESISGIWFFTSQIWDDLQRKINVKIRTKRLFAIQRKGIITTITARIQPRN